MKFLLLVLGLALAPLLLAGADERTDPAKTAMELGQVHWYRSLDTAVDLAKDSAKPIYLQFQEVPG